MDNNLFKQFEKKHTVVSKKFKVGMIVACATLAVAGGTLTGYFAYKASHAIPNNHEIVLDPTIESEVKITEVVTTKEGHKQCEVRSYEKEITEIKVTIGGTLLTKDVDYIQEEINDEHVVSGYKVTVFRKTIDKYSGSINIVPKFNESSSEELLKKIEALEKEIKSKTEELKKAKETIEIKEAEIEAKNKEISEKTATIEKLKEQIAELEESHKKEKEKLEAELKKAQDDLEEANKQIAELTDQLKEKEEALAKATETIEELQAELKEAKEDLEEAEKEAAKVTVVFISKEGNMVSNAKITPKSTFKKESITVPEVPTNGYKWQLGGADFTDETVINATCVINEVPPITMTLNHTELTLKQNQRLDQGLSVSLSVERESSNISWSVDAPGGVEIVSHPGQQGTNIDCDIFVGPATPTGTYTITCTDSITTMSTACKLYVVSM